MGNGMTGGKTSGVTSTRAKTVPRGGFRTRIRRATPKRRGRSGRRGGPVRAPTCRRRTRQTMRRPSTRTTPTGAESGPDLVLGGPRGNSRGKHQRKASRNRTAKTSRSRRPATGGRFQGSTRTRASTSSIQTDSFRRSSTSCRSSNQRSTASMRWCATRMATSPCTTWVCPKSGHHRGRGATQSGHQTRETASQGRSDASCRPTATSWCYPRGRNLCGLPAPPGRGPTGGSSTSSPSTRTGCWRSLISGG
mmetsp:Transcript_16471/g.36838  ORF Transcript_16471/g.36838 Transcript_16471/m.36838 type:complete len:250 (+) Transcript_16471:254-1003(+)